MSSGDNLDRPSEVPLSRAYAEGDLIAHKYRLEGILGEGGMGMVWVARNEALDSKVALKLIRSDVHHPEAASRLLQDEVVMSPAMARQEVERYTFRAPGQATSYFYGYTRWLQLRSEVEGALGPHFDRQRYHDFLLAQGLLPPDVLRKAVLEEFVPAEKARPAASR